MGRIQSVGLCIQYTNEMCALFAPVLTAVQILALRMFSHAILPWVRKPSYTVLIDLSLMELHNVRDSAAPRSFVDSWSRAFSDSKAWLRKARR